MRPVRDWQRAQQDQAAQRRNDRGATEEFKELRNEISGLKVQVAALYALLAEQRDSAMAPA
jgi:hypothetical protein